jgi:serine/threonine protein kinase
MAKQSLFCKTTVYELLRKREPLFSGWRVDSFLGSGVSGCVFKMLREDLGQTFVAALKVIPLTRKLDSENRTLDSLQESIGQDAREIVHLYSIGNHQNVVGWYNHEVFQERDKDAVIALVAVMMEYLPNTLSSLIKKGPVNWQRTLEILIDCLSGLEHVHGKQILHRDLKPGNIFITADGTAKIGDFGVARKISEGAYAETRVGTPLYIAPEVLKDPLGQGYAHQVDIYSLALVAYEMLHGKLPFEDVCQGNRTCMVNQRLSGEPITLDPALPPGVTKAILGALAFDPKLRYGTAREFRLALERTLQSGGRETILPRGQQIKQSAPQQREAAYGESPVRERHLRTQPHKQQETYPGNQGQGSHYGPIPLGRIADQDPPSSGLLGLLHSPQGILACAALGCAAAYFTRQDLVQSSLALIVFYLLAPLYMLTVNTSKGLLITGSFFGSYVAYNYLATGSFNAAVDVFSGALALIYLGILGFMTWFKKRD